MKVVIEIYLIITSIIIIWKIENIIESKIKENREAKKYHKYHEIVSAEVRSLKNKKNVSENHLLFLQKELKNTNNLRIFEDVLTKIRDLEAELVEKYCIKIASVFQILLPQYKAKNSVQKAYFMHFLFIFPEIMQNDDNIINYAMMHFVFDKSIYCRENAMLFFYHKGSPRQVVNSLKKISKRNLYYSPKLLADDLLLFSGDPKSLSALLLSEFNEFNPNFQVAIMNYIRFKGEDRNEEIYKMLISRKYDKEVELAMIRYFANHKYDQAVEILLEMMRDYNLYSDEYRIVTAYALATYDTKETRRILARNLTNPNFYIRKNAAVSLSKMDITIEEIKKVIEEKEQDANEMIEYVWQERCFNLPKQKKTKREKQERGV